MKDRYNEIAKNCKYDVYKRALVSTVNKAFGEKTGSGVTVNKKLAEQWHRPIIKKFKGRKAYAR